MNLMSIPTEHTTESTTLIRISINLGIDVRCKSYMLSEQLGIMDHFNFLLNLHIRLSGCQVQLGP